MNEFTNVNAIAPGCFALDGEAALAYVRSRTPEYKINGQWVLGDQDAPDLHRIARQQEFIRKLAGLAISKSLGDPFLALDISDRVLGDIKADQNLQRSDVNSLINAFRTVDVNDHELRCSSRRSRPCPTRRIRSRHSSSPTARKR